MSMSRDPKREQYWRQAVVDWKKSGLSVRVFCLQRRLSEPSFYAWRRELQKREGKAAPELKFVPVQVRGAAVVEIALPDGLLVRVPTDVEMTTVADLVAALRARATPC